MEGTNKDVPRKEFHKYAKITKARLGQVIIRECGNEGTEDTKETAERRRLLQKVIEVIQEDAQFERMSENMLITVYESYGYTIKSVAGNGLNKVVVSNGRDGEAQVVWRKRNTGCVIF